MAGLQEAQTGVSDGVALELAQTREELKLWRARAAELQARLVESRAREGRLITELNRLGDRTVERELSLLRMQREIAQRGPRTELGQAIAAVLGLPEETEAPSVAAEPIVDPGLERGRELVPALNANFKLEGLFGLRLLEAGRVPRAADSAAEAGCGPVVFQRLDSEGRLAGHLFARRLYLTGSRAAHTLTLHLRDGYSASQGQRIPFDETGLDLPLKNVDPEPFLRAAPELFTEAPAAELDDGSYPRALVQYHLNRLLSAVAAGSIYQLVDFEGVRDGVLLGVELVERDLERRELRRLFADRMRLERAGKGVSLVLEEGASLKGGEQMPFLDGHLTLYFPSADPADWTNAGLPVLGPRPPPEPAPGPK